MAIAIDLPEWPVRIAHCATAGRDPALRFDPGPAARTAWRDAKLFGLKHPTIHQAGGRPFWLSCPGLTRASMPRPGWIVTWFKAWIAGSSPAMTGEGAASREGAHHESHGAGKSSRPNRMPADIGSKRGLVSGASDALRRHWPEYLMEAAGLGLFMVSAGLFGTLLFHPGSPVVALLPEPLARQALMA